MSVLFRLEHRFRSLALADVIGAVRAALPGSEVEVETSESYNPNHDPQPRSVFVVRATIDGGGSVVVRGEDPAYVLNVWLSDVGWHVYESVEASLRGLGAIGQASPRWGLGNARSALEVGRPDVARGQLERYVKYRGKNLDHGDPRLAELRVDLADDPDSQVADALLKAPSAVGLWERLIDHPCPGALDARHAAWALAMARPHSRVAWEAVDARDLGAFAEVIERWLGPGDEPALSARVESAAGATDRLHASPWYELYSSGRPAVELPGTEGAGQASRPLRVFRGRPPPDPDVAVPVYRAHARLEWIGAPGRGHPAQLRGRTLLSRTDLEPPRATWYWGWSGPAQGVCAALGAPIRAFAFGAPARVRAHVAGLRGGRARCELRRIGSSDPVPALRLPIDEVVGTWSLDPDRPGQRHEALRGSWLKVQAAGVVLHGFDDSTSELRTRRFPVDRFALEWNGDRLEFVDELSSPHELSVVLRRRPDGGFDVIVRGYDVFPWGAEHAVVRA